MSPLVLRRLRGAVGTMLTWSVAWAAVAAAFGLALWLVIPAVRESTRLWEIAVGFSFAGGFAGAASGLAFALLLMLTESRRGLDDLRLPRVGAWGALAAAVAGLVLSRDPTFLCLCAGLGSAAAGGSLVAARRAVAAPREPRYLPHA